MGFAAYQALLLGWLAFVAGVGRIRIIVKPSSRSREILANHCFVQHIELIILARCHGNLCSTSKFQLPITHFAQPNCYFHTDAGLGGTFFFSVVLDDSRIHLWLENVLDHPQGDCAAPRKRKSRRQRLTPPYSAGGTSGMEHTSTPKRRRIGDDDKTPQAKGARTGSQLSSLSSISLPPSQQGDTRSQASSPRRQFMGLN